MREHGLSVGSLEFAGRGDALLRRLPLPVVYGLDYGQHHVDADGPFAAGIYGTVTLEARDKNKKRRPIKQVKQTRTSKASRASRKKEGAANHDINFILCLIVGYHVCLQICKYIIASEKSKPKSHEWKGGRDEVLE